MKITTLSLALALIFSVFSTNSTQAQKLKVMSYNIHHGADKTEKLTLDEMGAYIKKSGADLVGLQEVDSMCNRSGKVDQMKRLAEITGMHYTFVRHFAYDGGAYGLGILSKYPISNVKNHRLSLLPYDEKKPSLAFLVAEIELQKMNVIFSTAHFGLNAPTRLAQSDEVLALLKDSTLPAIFTGDLNATPESTEIGKLNAYFTETGPDSALTFPVNKPVKKIDYIMVSKAHLKKVVAYQVDEILSSDHLPVVCEVKVRR
ncbi:MAG TPA: endonuclease/exonuclease/phosphatase family protein [Sphingobacteriaceae bacterium]